MELIHVIAKLGANEGATMAFGELLSTPRLHIVKTTPISYYDRQNRCYFGVNELLCVRNVGPGGSEHEEHVAVPVAQPEIIWDATTSLNVRGGT